MMVHTRHPVIHRGVLYDRDVTRAQREENGFEPRPLAADDCDGQRVQASSRVDVLQGGPTELEAVEVAEPRACTGALGGNFHDHVVNIGAGIGGEGVLGVAVVYVSAKASTAVAAAACVTTMAARAPYL